MPQIRKLTTDIVNKIAAGEVIERPASVVKELVENSVDAGARRINVHVIKGGTELLRVTDDGGGISADDLPLAVSSHATSKIESADDLFRIHTFGFRGEALASIAQVSHFRIRSRVPDSQAGHELMVLGGEPGECAAVGCPVGTDVEVKNLFFNTPVRRRFLRTTQTEMGHIIEAVHRIALAYPQIHFSLRHGDNELLDLVAVSDWRTRIEHVFGREMADALIAVETADHDIRLQGYVANPSHDRSTNKMQYLFLNGRYIRDRSLGHALAEAYRGLLMTGRYPIGLVRIEMPADQVDVNVHPTKMEVRFVDGGRLYSQLLSTIRAKFLSTDLTSHARLAGRDAPQDAEVGRQPTPGPHYEQHRMPLDFSPGTSAAPFSAAAPAFRPFPDYAQMPRLGTQATAIHPAEAAQLPATSAWPDSDSGSTSPTSESPSAVSIEAERSMARLTHRDEGTPAMQVYNRYLITETDEGVVVIDQHALHERILYEELRKKVLGSQLEIQRLLVPEPVQLTSTESGVIMDHADTLLKLGIEVERISSSTLIISAYPAMISNLSPAELLRQVAARLADSSVRLERRDLIDELLHMIACKAAIKAGDPLTGEEIAALLRQRFLVQDAHHCPHGRPTALVFSREELDRRFKRI